MLSPYIDFCGKQTIVWTSRSGLADSFSTYILRTFSELNSPGSKRDSRDSRYLNETTAIIMADTVAATAKPRQLKIDALFGASDSTVTTVDDSSSSESEEGLAKRARLNNAVNSNNPSWELEFPWVKHRDGRLYCSICQKASVRNTCKRDGKKRMSKIGAKNNGRLGSEKVPISLTCTKLLPNWAADEYLLC